MRMFNGSVGTRGFFNRALTDDEITELDLKIRSHSGFVGISSKDWNALEHIPSEGNWSLTLSKRSWRTLWRRKWTFTRYDSPPPLGARVWIRVIGEAQEDSE